MVRGPVGYPSLEWEYFFENLSFPWLIRSVCGEKNVIFPHTIQKKSG